ncbi:MAG: cupredoxin domain-containing protein [Candidatus Woesearchaeota archaeon]
MKKYIFFILLLISFFVFTSCGNDDKEDKTLLKNTNEQIKTPEIKDSEQKLVVVEIRSEGFRPQIVEISKGDVVKWVNMDSKDHTITSQNFPAPKSTSPKSSGRLQPGESWTKEFDIEGYYSYTDLYDENLKGKVVVK